MKKTYNKLIRDKIPEIMKRNGKSFKITECTNENFPIYLDKKLKEEMKEYFTAQTPKDRVEELYDIVEICETIALEVYGVSERNFIIEKSKKRKERGGFDKRIILKHISDS